MDGAATSVPYAVVGPIWNDVYASGAYGWMRPARSAPSGGIAGAPPVVGVGGAPGGAAGGGRRRRAGRPERDVLPARRAVRTARDEAIVVRRAGRQPGDGG